MVVLEKFSQNSKEIVLKETDKGCLECVSHSKDDCGYTRIMYKHKHERLFRVIYQLKYGDIPNGMVVRHKCDNPSCCNIEHLELGTQYDNVQDMIKRNRSGFKSKKISLRGTQNKSNKLNENEVIEIYLSKFGYNKLSKKYNVSKTTIRLIKKKQMWEWLTNKLD